MSETNPQDSNEPDETQEDDVRETEVTHENPHITPEVEALATFSEQEGPLSFRIIPVIEGGQTDWRILVYMRGTQGPVYQSRDGLTDEAVEQFGVSPRLQDRINGALAYATAELEVPEGSVIRSGRSARSTSLK